MSYQFPPSSPLIDDDVHYKKKPVHSGQRGRQLDYPTPNPSLSLFRSSSPVRSPVRETPSSPMNHHTKPVGTINKDFDIMNPDALVLRIPLMPHTHNLVIGRSLKLCDFFFGVGDKLVLRQHLLITYNHHHVVMRCLGVNGVAVRIPKACFVYSSQSPNSYVLVENKTGEVPNVAKKLKRAHKLIRLDGGHTEFALLHNETIALPRFGNIMCEVNNHVMLVNPEDGDDLTDDEMTEVEEEEYVGEQVEEEHMEEIDNVEGVEEKVRIVESVEQEEEKVRIVKSVEQVEEKVEMVEKVESVEKFENVENFKDIENIEKVKNVENVKQEENTIVVSETQADNLQTTEMEIEDEENLNISTQKLYPINSETDKENAVPTISNTFSKPPVTPTKQVTPPSINTTSPSVSVLTQSPIKRKAIVEQPTERKRAKTTLESHHGHHSDALLDDVRKILINHLAFSRLSLTPALTLNAVLVKTQKLSLAEVTAMLNETECVGVIYRQGKDAAGKPLEEEYYYIPEKDVDPERTQLVALIKGHGGLRACRRTHKQYYWKKPAPIKK